MQHEFDLKSQVWLHETKSKHHFITSSLKWQNSVPQIQEFLICGNALFIYQWAGFQKYAKLNGFSISSGRRKMQFRGKRCFLWINRTIRANQITRISSDFRMDVIKTSVVSFLQFFFLEIAHMLMLDVQSIWCRLH